MSRILLAFTLAAAGASQLLTSSCPTVEVDIGCNMVNGCNGAIVLIHGPDGKVYDPLAFDDVDESVFGLGGLDTNLGGVPDFDTLLLDYIDADNLCGATDGTGIAVSTFPAEIDHFSSFDTFSMEPENNGSGCSCSDMYFTILVPATDPSRPEGLAIGALYNHKLESTSTASVAYGKDYLIGTSDNGNTVSFDSGSTAFMVRFTPSGSSRSSWLNWFISLSWF